MSDAEMNDIRDEWLDEDWESMLYGDFPSTSQGIYSQSEGTAHLYDPSGNNEDPSPLPGSAGSEVCVLG